MADQVLLLAQLQTFFQALVSNFLGTSDPGAVRAAWPTDGAPAWPISYDVVFLLIQPETDPYTQQLEETWSDPQEGSATVSLAYTFSFRLGLTFYGPNSFDNADLVRSQFFLGSATTALAAQNLALITDVPMPSRMPELWGGEWWDRSDLAVRFYELVVRESATPLIQSAPISVTQTN